MCCCSTRTQGTAEGSPGMARCNPAGPSSTAVILLVSSLLLRMLGHSKIAKLPVRYTQHSQERAGPRLTPAVRSKMQMTTLAAQRCSTHSITEKCTQHSGSTRPDADDLYLLPFLLCSLLCSPLCLVLLFGVAFPGPASSSCCRWRELEG